MARHYSKQGLWSLFLMCALPLHVWTMVLALRFVSQIITLLDVWAAAAVVSYGLVFALVESILLFLVAMLLGYLVSVRWEPERRIAAMSVLVLVLCLWAIVGQLFFLLNVQVPGAVVGFLVHTQHPLRILYVGIPVVVSATFLIPLALVLRTGRGTRFMTGLIERLSLLALLYLVFDAAALIIVVVRNV
jgi:hypothetical protein